MYIIECLLRSVFTVAIQVVDVAKAITNIIMDPRNTAGKTYELTGSVLYHLVMSYIHIF